MTTPIKYDDVLAAADAYCVGHARGQVAGPGSVVDKLRWDLENKITGYAQAWADEKCSEWKSKYEAREKEAHELSEMIIKIRREKNDTARMSKNLIDQKNAIMESMQAALEAARLLCANLDHGGVGSKSLVENFRKLDDQINEVTNRPRNG